MIVTLAAGVSQNITVAGARFYFVDGNGKINVRLKGSGDSRDFDLYPRQGVNSDVRFAGVEVTNISDEEQTIEFEISDREVFDNRIPEVAQVEPVGGAMPVSQSQPWIITGEADNPLSVSVKPAVSAILSFSGRINSAVDSTGNIVVLGVLAPVGSSWGSRKMLIERVSVRVIGKLSEKVAFGITNQIFNISAPAQLYDFVGGSAGNFSAISDSVSLGDDVVMGNTDTPATFVQPFDTVITSSVLGARNVVFDLSAAPYLLTEHSSGLHGFGVVMTGMDEGYGDVPVKAIDTGIAYVQVKCIGKFRS